MLATAMLLNVSVVSANQAGDDLELSLAERLVQLQRLEAFFQEEWDFQIQSMEEAMEEYPEAKMAIPEGYLEAMRQQQVDGQVSDWVEAWAMTFDEERLRELVEYLERPESQAWIAARLEAYPHFLESLATRAEAMVEVFQEEYSDEFPQASEPGKPMKDVEPVVDSGFEDLLEFAPGSRIKASLDDRWFAEMSVPANHPAIREVFADLEVQLVPDGEEAARVSQVSAQRAFADPESCDAALVRLESSLAGHFSGFEETDCGHKRYTASGGDIRMSLTCSEQEAVAASRLRLVVSHKPTEDSAHRRLMARVDENQSEGDDEAEAEASDSGG